MPTMLYCDMAFFERLTILLLVAVHVVLASSDCPEGYSSFDKNNCFRVYTDKVGLHDARKRCQRTHGAYLAKIDSREENGLVARLKTEAGIAASGEPMWIGLTSESSTDDACWYWHGYTSWEAF
eukprot:TRINITY_DN51291_c0_g1_i1.p1 TRINITY_DN51291_c0_g1~~TRINITY_DN51291_c0_g1_i1.p1  ORF type:complete len:124 (+),score=13.54 TRINITY_DN51291_c0_g1_i1:46-417(+)